MSFSLVALLYMSIKVISETVIDCSAGSELIKSTCPALTFSEAAVLLNRNRGIKN